MLPSLHKDCSIIFYLIIMRKENSDQYQWCPNERWEDYDPIKPSLWISSEVHREWWRCTKNLKQYAHGISLHMVAVHQLPCTEIETVKVLRIER